MFPETNLLSPVDEAEAHVARALKLILWTLIAASLLLVLGGVLANRAYLIRWVRIVMILNALCLPTFILVRYGFVRFASVFTVLWLWAAVTVLTLTAGGVFAVASFVYVIIVFVAGLLLGARAGIGTALLCIVTALGLVVIELSGHLPSGQTPHSPVARWIALTLFILIMMSLQSLAARTIREALLSTRKELEGRKQVEQALKANEEVLRQFIKYAPAAIAMFDTEMRYLQASDGWLAAYHLEANEIIGKLHYQIFPDLPNRWKEVHARVLAGAHERCDEDPLPSPGGTHEWLQWEAIPWRKAGGEIGGMILFTQVITKRKQAEEELRLSEQRFAKAFQASPEPIAIYRHSDGRLLEVNERWQSLYGHPREAAIGHTSLELELITPEGRENLRSLLEERGSLRELEVELYGKDREVRNVSLSAEQIVINGERCDIFLHRDITERRRVELENRQLIHDLGERVKELTALHLTARVLQQERGDPAVILTEIAALLPPAFQYPEITAGRVRLGETEAVTPGFNDALPVLRADFHTADGELGSIEVVYTKECPPEAEGPYLIEERALITTLADMLCTDYDRRQSEDALRESELRFRQLTDNMREVLWLYAPDYSKVLFISPSYETIWGRTRASLYQNPHSFLDNVHPRDRPRVEETTRKKRETGFDHEYRLMMPNGTIRWIWDRGFPIHDGEGKLYRIAGIAEDITDRKQAEIALRTSQEQLRALSAKAQSAREEEGRRIAREIHDELGSSLTGLKWDLEKIDMTLGRSDKSWPDSDIHIRIVAMIGLMEATIGTVRRISADLRPSILDDLGMVAAIEWQAQQFRERTGVECQWRTEMETADVSRESATAVFRIFQEILTNVLRHSGATRIQVELRKRNDRMELQVVDNGRGISESEKANNRSLGLLGMKERALLVGGEVNIDGASGQGTTVLVRIPLGT